VQFHHGLANFVATAIVSEAGTLPNQAARIPVRWQTGPGPLQDVAPQLHRQNRLSVSHRVRQLKGVRR
jgi:hypothetical protein